MTLRELITARLEHLGITRRRASLAAGKKPAWLDNMGERPTLITLTQVAHILGLPLAVVLDGSSAPASCLREDEGETRGLSHGGY